jgi:hypothetical protein
MGSEKPVPHGSHTEPVSRFIWGVPLGIYRGIGLLPSQGTQTLQWSPGWQFPQAAFAKSTDSSLGPANVQGEQKSKIKISHFCLQCTELFPFTSHLEFQEQQVWWINIL